METKLTEKEIEQMLTVDTQINISQSKKNGFEIHIQGNTISVCQCLQVAAKLDDRFRWSLTDAAHFLQEE